jgi:8-oxo-dGTP pyrophosphatase MutT (NUDIX family)
VTVDFATMLAEEARDRRSANLVPRDAATLIIMDRSGPEPKVLFGRRHPNHRFMPGKFVFPGGRIEAGDRKMVATGTLDQRCEARLLARVTRPSLQRTRALALAAIRETFEETGLMFGTREYGAPEVPAGTPWEAFATHGVYPDLEALTFIARAITPPRRPRRFDARFFVVDYASVALKIEGVVGPDAELDQLVWATIAETADIALPAVTRVVLAELAARIEAGFSPFLPVPFYREVRGMWLREEL